jgi:predicted transcriptional regulator
MNKISGQTMEEVAADQALMHMLAEERKKQRISQRALAAQMATSQPTLHLMEIGKCDSRISTLERFAAALGKRVVYRLVDA